MTGPRKYDRSSNNLQILKTTVESRMRELHIRYGGMLYFYTASIAWTLPALHRHRLVSRIQQNRVQFLLEDTASSVVLDDWDAVEDTVTKLLRP